MVDDKPTTLGEFLRQEREQRGITIEQVASATKISVRTLHSLESDNYIDLPAKPFIRGFVTSYARFIGLEADEVLNKFNGFIDKKAMDRPTRESGHSGYVFEKREGEQSRAILWIIMGSFVVIGGLLIFVLKPSFRHHSSRHAEKLKAAYATASPSPSPVSKSLSKPTPASAPTPTLTPSPVPKSSPTPKPSPTVSTKPDPLNSGAGLALSEVKYKAIFKAQADLWVRYQVDDKPMMKFILRQDRILVLKAQNEIRIQTSNPTSMTFNYGSSGSRLFANEKTAVRHPSGLTLFFPPELAKKSSDPFAGSNPLPTTSPPPSRTAPKSTPPTP